MHSSDCGGQAGELRGAITEFGFRLSDTALRILVNRYSKRSNGTLLLMVNQHADIVAQVKLHLTILWPARSV